MLSNDYRFAAWMSGIIRNLDGPIIYRLLTGLGADTRSYPLCGALRLAKRDADQFVKTREHHMIYSAVLDLIMTICEYRRESEVKKNETYDSPL